MDALKTIPVEEVNRKQRGNAHVIRIYRWYEGHHSR